VGTGGRVPRDGFSGVLPRRPGTFERARRCWEQAREAFLETGAADDAEKFAVSSTKPGRSQSVMIAATVSRNTRLEYTISPV